MTQNDNVVAEKTITEKTESEEIFEKINKKIDSLFNVLRLGYLENPKPENVEVEAKSSPLINRLKEIENRITDLLNGIRI